MPYTPSVTLLVNTLGEPTQNRVRAHVIRELEKLGRSFEVDASGNVFSDMSPDKVKPWVVGHMDTVHRDHREDTVLSIKENNGWLSCFWTGQKQEGPWKQTGIGGDDKVGVWACLEACRRQVEGGPEVAVAFVTDEEIGCVGTKAALKNKERFTNGSCFIQLDRRGDSDAISYTNGLEIWTPEFAALIKPAMEEMKFTKANGSLTDIGEFARELRKPAINISSGYHNAHSDSEVVHTGQAVHSLGFAFAIIDAVIAGENKTGTLPEPKAYSYRDYDDYSGGYYGTGGWLGGRYTGKVDRTKGETEVQIKARLARLERLVAAELGVVSTMVTAVISGERVAVYRHPIQRLWYFPEKPDATGFAPDHADRIAAGWRLDSTTQRLVMVYLDNWYVAAYLDELSDKDILNESQSMARRLRPHLPEPEVSSPKALADEATALAKTFEVRVTRVTNAIATPRLTEVVYPKKLAERLAEIKKNPMPCKYVVTDMTVQFYHTDVEGHEYTVIGATPQAGVEKLRALIKEVSGAKSKVKLAKN